jgi:hypothetical protein
MLTDSHLGSLFAEAKCQALISYADLVTQIEAMKNPPLKAVYVDFLNAVYVDAETPLSVCAALRGGALLRVE